MGRAGNRLPSIGSHIIETAVRSMVWTSENYHDIAKVPTRCEIQAQSGAASSRCAFMSAYGENWELQEEEHEVEMSQALSFLTEKLKSAEEKHFAAWYLQFQDVIQNPWHRLTNKEERPCVGVGRCRGAAVFELKSEKVGWEISKDQEGTGRQLLWEGGTWSG